MTSNFSFTNSVLNRLEIIVLQFLSIQNCCLQTLSVWNGPKFVIWERSKVEDLLLTSGECDLILLNPFIVNLTQPNQGFYDQSDSFCVVHKTV